MYLMALTNPDYVLATIFFAVIFLTAYLFRRKQQSANKFLFADDKVMASQNNNWILGFGVIELVACGAIGAIYGISGLYYVSIILLAGFIVTYYITQEIFPDSVYDYLAKKISPGFAATYAILCVILLLFWLSITVVLTSKLFLSLLGWSFVNSVFGLMLLTIICIEVGGYAGIRYNRSFWLIIICLMFIFIIGLALHTTSIARGAANLEQLAINQDKNKDFYTTLNYNFHLKNIIGASIATWIIIPLISAIKVSKRINTLPLTVLKTCLVALMVGGGILAIATPVENIVGSGNSKIITYQAQLPDGQIGYIVKAVPTQGDKDKNLVPGIIPPVLNDKTSLLDPGKYDYKLANVVVFRHYLPGKFVFLVVLIIMAAYMYAISHYLLSIAKIVAIDIWHRLNLFTQYGEEGKLWCSRMSVIFAGGLGLFGGYFLQNWFDLINFGYIISAFAAILIFILLIAIFLRSKVDGKK